MQVHTKSQITHKKRSSCVRILMNIQQVFGLKKESSFPGFFFLTKKLSSLVAKSISKRNSITSNIEFFVLQKDTSKLKIYSFKE